MRKKFHTSHIWQSNSTLKFWPGKPSVFTCFAFLFFHHFQNKLGNRNFIVVSVYFDTKNTYKNVCSKNNFTLSRIKWICWNHLLMKLIIFSDVCVPLFINLIMIFAHQFQYQNFILFYSLIGRIHKGRTYWLTSRVKISIRVAKHTKLSCLSTYIVYIDGQCHGKIVFIWLNDFCFIFIKYMYT